MNAQARRRILSELIEAADQAADRREGIGGGAVEPGMLGEKIKARVAYRALRVVVAVARLPRNVELGIQAHAAIVHVGRADAQETIVDQEKLRMNVSGHVFTVLGP